VGDAYGDIPRGIFIIRGENVVLLGEIVSSPSSNWLYGPFPTPQTCTKHRQALVLILNPLIMM